MEKVSTFEQLSLMKTILFKYVSEWGRSKVKDWWVEIHDGYGNLIGTEEEIYEFWGPRRIKKIQELYSDAMKKYSKSHIFFDPETKGLTEK